MMMMAQYGMCSREDDMEIKFKTLTKKEAEKIGWIVEGIQIGMKSKITFWYGLIEGFISGAFTYWFVTQFGWW